MKANKTNIPATKALLHHPYLLSLFAIFIMLSLFGCQIQNEQKTKQIVKTFPNQQGTKTTSLSLFEEKCSVCHRPERALTVFKDPEVWEETIRRMQYYSKGDISDSQTRELVEFHIIRQQSEIDTFQETCTKCHDEERINNRSMSPEQWQATIKRMQQKAPEFISDEKVIILSSYFHRRELSMAKIFYDKCPLCHFKSSETATNQALDQQTTTLIVLARQEFGGSFQIRNFRSLRESHIERQKRNIQLYERDCHICHIAGVPNKRNVGIESLEKRTRSEWVVFIASLQKIELTKEIQKSINSQIRFHISRH